MLLRGDSGDLSPRDGPSPLIGSPTCPPARAAGWGLKSPPPTHALRMWEIVVLHLLHSVSVIRIITPASADKSEGGAGE